MSRIKASSVTLGVLAAIGAMAGTARAWPGWSTAVYAASHQAGAEAPAPMRRAAPVTGYRISMPSPLPGGAHVEVSAAPVAAAGSGLIYLPDNTRGPRLSARVEAPEQSGGRASSDEGEEGYYVIVDSGRSVAPFGTHGVRRAWRGRPVAVRGSGGAGVPEFGANDLHRRAQLQFGEAAYPKLAGQDDGFRRAQLEFHRSTLTPGVVRQSDGLRHERVPGSGRQRTGW